MKWHLSAAELAAANGKPAPGEPIRLCEVTPQDAGWTYSGLSVYELSGGPVEVDLSEREAVIVPLSARDLQVVVDDVSYELTGRDGVFAAVSDWLYAPLGSQVTISGGSGEVAVCTARATRRLAARYTAAEDVEVEVRGAGRASRQVTNIATPGSFSDADKINVCEVITPGGNLSSWPPHRHDGIADCPVDNEEIYYFRIGRQDAVHGHPSGQGLFHVYSADGAPEAVDDTVTVRDGDVYLVPHGYHGPSVAPPEYPMYFLNVLAGPAAERSMAFCDDPTHAWIRESWDGQDQDPRLPMTTAKGRVTQ